MIVKFKKTKIINYILILCFTGNVFASNEDSSLVRGENLTQAQLTLQEQIGGKFYTDPRPIRQSDEKIYKKCPAGFKGVSTGTDMYVESQRWVIEYLFPNGRVAGITKGEWVGTEEECEGYGYRSYSCTYYVTVSDGAGGFL